MSSLPPLTLRRPSRAPEISAALLALRGQGLELPSPRKDSISPQSIPAFEDKYRLSPLSIISAPSNQDKSLDLFSANDEGQPSAISFETEVSNILDLYMNLSRQSPKSDYEEEVVLEVDEEDAMEEERISVPSFHQPKAYRDTIAPLLEHQFSGDKLTVPAMPSPLSIASIPMLTHPNATHSVPSLDLTPDVSPNLPPIYQSKAAISGTSIQITPEMSPDPHFRSSTGQRYEFEAETALEVPDVREADGWYDQPLSPVSPEEISSTLRDSQMSTVSPNGIERHQRQLTFEALSPPQPQESPNPQPVDYYEDNDLPGPSRAIVSEVIYNHMVPPPLDLNRSSASGDHDAKSSSAQQPTIHLMADDDLAPKSRYASLIVNDPIEGPMRTYLTPPPVDRTRNGSPSSVSTRWNDIEEIYKSGSAFSDSTADSLVATAKFGKKLKKAFRFGKKKESKSAKQEKAKDNSVPIPAPTPALDEFTDDIESYKYGYWKAHALAHAQANHVLPPPHRLQSPDMENARRASIKQEQIYRTSAGTDSAARASPRPQSKPEDWPMTRPTEQNWYETNNQKKTHESLLSQVSAASTGHPPYMTQAQSQPKMPVDHAEGTESPDPDRISYYSRPASRADYTLTASESIDALRQSPEAVSISRPSSLGPESARRSAGMSVSYNNDLFEASGGKKRSGFGSRLFMSAEEKRKLKVKESIVVVGSARMGGDGKSSRRTLVNI